MKHSTRTRLFNKATALAIISVVATLLFSLLASIVTSGRANNFDDAVLLWINQHASPTFDALFLNLTHLGGSVFITGVSLVLLAYVLYKKQYHKALFVSLSMGGMITLNLLLKSFFERPRPDLWQWLVTETSYSFPSGHATASMALALTILLVFWWTKWRLAAIIVAGLFVFVVGFSRMYLGVHYLTDIFGGWLLATAWVTCIACFVYVYRNRVPKPIEEKAA
ncbi:MAG: phosphatase PAP2 family protein [Candidatus Microsaccharimonas sp.]